MNKGLTGFIKNVSLKLGDNLDLYTFLFAKLKKSPTELFATIFLKALKLLKEGDTLNINVDDTVDFYVSNQKYFKAEMGEVKGNASVKLTKRLKKEILSI